MDKIPKSMIRLASPDIRSADLEELNQCLLSGNIVQGQQVDTFEKELVKFTELNSCAVVSSGTAALHLTLKALDIGNGDDVIVPAFTFPATANAVENLGANVLLCDVCPASYVVTPELLRNCINDNKSHRLKAVIVVDEFGFPPELRAIRDICNQYSLILLEDAACALGTIADNHHVGYYSDAACFSFHPRKAITTGEGGAVISQNSELVDKIKILRNHGIITSSASTDFLFAGLNYRMTDFQATLGISQLGRFHNEITQRRNLASLYYQELSYIDDLQLPRYSETHSWQSFMICLKNNINRQKIITSLHNNGIETNLGAQALNCLSYFKRKYNYNQESFPVASRLFNHGLVLPLYGKLNKQEILYIAHKAKILLGRS